MKAWHRIPTRTLGELAEAEMRARRYYRPAYSMSRAFAQRRGTRTRGIAMAALADSGTTKEDILRKEDGCTAGKFYNDNSSLASEKTVLDPFFGGGSILAECNRLGANTIGYEVNPTLWFNVKKIFDQLNQDAFEEQWNHLLQTAQEEFSDLYSTHIPESAENVPVENYLRQRVAICTTCDEKTLLYKDQYLSKGRSGHASTLRCPNLDCVDPIFNSDVDGSVTCPCCGEQFDPEEGNYSRGMFTCSQGHRSELLEASRESNSPPEYRLVAIRYTYGDQKRFKAPDEHDFELEAAASNRFSEAGRTVLVPNAELPEGETYRSFKKSNITHHNQLYTPRQSLVFSHLLRSIQEVDTDNIAEFLLLAVVNQIPYHTAYTPWNQISGKPDPLFRTNRLREPITVVETNPFQSGYGGISSGIKSVLDGKRFCEQPQERRRCDEDIDIIDIRGERIGEPPEVQLSAESATRLAQTKESVDLIFTDPPYFDNVQYGPLTDLFYVWYQQILEDDYPAFSQHSVSEEKEIVVDRSRNKGEEMFVQALTNAFAEMHRVLRRDGQLVFFQHFSAIEGLTTILECLLEAGFAIDGFFPIPEATKFAEDEYSARDILVFADKTKAKETITRQQLKQNLYVDMSDFVEEERTHHPDLNRGDLKIILLGRSLREYSQHYPNVSTGDEPLSVAEALDLVEGIVQEHLHES